ncbi:MAG TPA: methionine--tRNA ligase, partial [bacterium]|nr:methionine--tRNA ligase [bacterium]
GNVIDPFDLIGRYGTDAVRYYLLREITPFEDSDITEEKFKEVYNANLANGLGNLTARIMKMSEQYLSQCSHPRHPMSGMGVPKEYHEFMDNYELNKAMDFIWDKISELDLHIQKTEPFKVAKQDKEKAKEILRYLISELSQIAITLRPFLPETSEKILDAIKQNKMPKPLFLRKK